MLNGLRGRTHMLAGATLLLLGVLAPAATAGPAVKDSTGREVTSADTSRIVSIGGSVTEILYALGLEDRVVAIDSTSFYPRRALAEKPNVGYMRALSAEGVLGLNPSLILAVEGSGPKETLAVLEAARVPMIVVPDSYSGDGIIEKVNLIARVAGVDKPGECLASAVRADLDSLATLRKRIDRPVRTMFVLSFVNGRAMVAGRKTAADGIIRMAGGVNAVDEFEGYKPINDEAIIAMKPDIILAMQRDSHPMTEETVFAHKGFQLTPAGERKALIVMDGLSLLGFGPRTARAAHDILYRFYPALALDGPPAGMAMPECHK